MIIEKRVRIWRTLKIPVIILSSVIVLTIVTIVLFFVVRGTRIKKALAETRTNICAGSLEHYVTAHDSLSELIDRYPGRSDVLSTTAWALSFGTYAYGFGPDNLAKSRSYIAKAKGSDDDDLYWAAKSMNELLEGRSAEAGKIARDKLKTFKKSDELKFVSALAHNASNNAIEGRIELQLLHTRKKPFVPAMLELAKLNHASGNLDEALSILVEVLAKQPDNIAAHIAAAHAEIDKGGAALELAEKEIEKIKPKFQGAPPGLYIQGYLAEGKLLVKKQDYGAAVAPLEKVRVKAPDNNDVIYYLVLSHRKSGKPLKALDLLSNYKDLKDIPDDVLAEFVESLLAVHRSNEAGPAVEELLARPRVDPAYAGYLAGLVAAQSLSFEKAASLMQSAGNYSDAGIRQALYMTKTGNLKEGVKLLKERSKSTGDKCAGVFYDWFRNEGSKVLEEKELFNSCPPDLKMYLLAGSGEYGRIAELLGKEASPARLPWQQYYMAIASLRTMGVTTAREEMEKIMTYSPESLQLFADMTAAYLDMGLAAKAVETARYCHEKNADKPLSHVLLAEALRHAGELDEAEKAVNEGGKLFPDELSIAIEKALLNLKKERTALARLTLEEEMDNITSADVMIKASSGLAQIYRSMGNKKEAETVLLTAARKLEKYFDPALSIDVYAELVSMRRSKGKKADIAKARNTFFSIAKKPYPSALLQLEGGKTLLEQEKIEDAIEQFNKSLAIDPAFKPAYEALKKLDALNEAQRLLFQKIFNEQI
ncbi:MAG: hypothetical protein ABIJ56_22900 [Pseudomonadota bacterium]